MNTETIIAIASIVIASSALGVTIWALLCARRMEKRLVNLLDQMISTQNQIQGLSDEMYNLLMFSRPVLSDNKLKNVLPKLAENFYDVFRKNELFLKSFLENHLDHTLVISKDAVEGKLHIRGVNLIDYAIELISLAEPNDKIFATSYIKTPEFWDTAAAKRYLREQERLIAERKVTVSRIFLYDDDDACQDARNITEMDNHSSKGVHVFTAIAPRIEADLREDMFLIEGRLAAEYNMSYDREELLGIWIWLDQNNVELITKRMKKLIDVSTPYVKSNP